MDLETVDGLLARLDQIVGERERSVQIINRELRGPGGSIRNPGQYRWRLDGAKELFERKEAELLQRLERTCRTIRGAQPPLTELSRANLNTRGNFRRFIAMGENRVAYDGKELVVPRMLPLPVPRPLYMSGGGEEVLGLLLRLAYTLPVNRQEYYFFDPKGLGQAVQAFHAMLGSRNLVPQGRVMCTPQELRDALAQVELYIRDLYAHTFQSAGDWAGYNAAMYGRNQLRRMLPYRVFVFTDVPAGMDQECFRMFETLLRHNGRCGLLVIFSCDASVWDGENVRSRMDQALLRCIDQQCISILDYLAPVSFSHLEVSCQEEALPGPGELAELVGHLRAAADRDMENLFSFPEILPRETLFTGSSAEGISAPMGFDTGGGSPLMVPLDDQAAHYLVGGDTGSGKSNLLHSLITSVCWRFSPEEVQLYLLDFKEGVEFSQYAGTLPHAALVAVEADTEYGVTVLRHLAEELSRRAGIFKSLGCRDLRSFREAGRSMPRLLVVIDEFQVLFENDRKQDTAALLSRIAKQGRSAGVHLVLATQSLKSLGDFGAIASQFAGRIVLRCGAEDSRLLLGGPASANDAGASLKVPYAILNTAHGSLSQNVKFAVPWAKRALVEEKLRQIRTGCRRLGTGGPEVNRVFRGQEFPRPPAEEAFRDPEGLTLTLGQTLDFEGKPLRCTLLPEAEQNVLLCGHSGRMKRGLLESLLRSARNCGGCDEAVYVGGEAWVGETDWGAVVLPDIPALLERYQAVWYERRILVILDNRNLTREAGPRPGLMPGYLSRKEPGEKLWEFLSEGPVHGSHAAVFFDSGNLLKASGAAPADFFYGVSYGVNEREAGLLAGQPPARFPAGLDNRAMFLVNQEIRTLFRPFIEGTQEGI
ncbi:FtsK/SpoIIIE domain-containing protein [Oscillospiraceae bacterium 38-13]